MKTAAQWKEEYDNDRYSIKGPRRLCFRTGDLVRAIQEDALRHAADIAAQFRDYDVSRDSLPIVNAILEAIPEHL
jgi:hypothetical protein